MSFWSRLIFNLWYFGDPPWDTGISPPELFAFIDSHPPGKALDLGCGTGTNVVTLARHGWQVTGIDFAWRAILQARRKASLAGVKAEFRVGDASSLAEISGSFNLILDIGCFHSLSITAREAYRNNLVRLLSEDGSFLLYAFFRDPFANGPGLINSDVEKLQERLNLVQRQDGTERGQRPSAWFTFRRQTEDDC